MARVLIIDDDKDLRRTLRRLLERAGHRTEEAADGGQGLVLFRDRSFDLVVTDLIMPEKEGIETIMELREESPDVRILAVSGGLSMDKEGVLEDAEALGADASLAKPFGVEEFIRTVESLLEGGGSG
jgi:CheY-like chemotaxis protein